METRQNLNGTIDSALGDHLDLIDYYDGQRTETQIHRISDRLALRHTDHQKPELKCCILFLPVSNRISFHLRITSGGNVTASSSVFP